MVVIEGVGSRTYRENVYKGGKTVPENVISSIVVFSPKNCLQYVK